ncbi:Mariner Mos1 transposase [Eumeta japonica]|uniref:Mariner Mos1 transposase n=1 Tax=Eumeta variegata TaxID=151549 RepID=A0A4C2A2J7_EUMVA|nr:Mariner Mos1 transposase [Eumeta japonica]
MIPTTTLDPPAIEGLGPQPYALACANWRPLTTVAAAVAAFKTDSLTYFSRRRVVKTSLVNLCRALTRGKQPSEPTEYTWSPSPIHKHDFERVTSASSVSRVCSLGLIANTMNVAVLTRHDLAAAPINRLLKWLAVADVFVMLEYVPFAIYSYMYLNWLAISVGNQTRSFRRTSTLFTASSNSRLPLDARPPVRMALMEPKELSLTGRKATTGAIDLHLYSARLCYLTVLQPSYSQHVSPALIYFSTARVNLLLCSLVPLRSEAVLGYTGTEYRRSGRSRSRRDVLPGKLDFPYSWAVYLLFHMHFAQIMHTTSICLTLSLAVWRYLAIKHDKIILLNDNARPHVAVPVKNYLKTFDWELLPHPPYSPDIAPSDHHLFRSIAHTLSEQRFTSHEDTKN